MSDAPPAVSIYTEDDELTTIRVGDGRVYDICYDGATGDWLVASENEGDVPVQMWVRTRDGAVQYVLERLGVIESATYDRAPERC